MALRTVLVMATATGAVVWTRMTPAKLEGSPLAVPTRRAVPRFSDFSVGEAFTDKPAPVDLASDPNARTFRTRLRQGAAKGPNFAGHYTIVSWGCGTDCQVTAVVDARNGRVVFAPFTAYSGTAFRRDSRLLIENPRPHEDTEGLPVSNETSFQYGDPGPGDSSFEYNRPGYWVWDGATFVKLDVADPRLR
jgi:hypothetical protein